MVGISPGWVPGSTIADVLSGVFFLLEKAFNQPPSFEVILQSYGIQPNPLKGTDSPDWPLTAMGCQARRNYNREDDEYGEKQEGYRGGGALAVKWQAQDAGL